MGEKNFNNIDRLDDGAVSCAACVALGSSWLEGGSCLLRCRRKVGGAKNYTEGSSGGSYGSTSS